MHRRKILNMKKKTIKEMKEDSKNAVTHPRGPSSGLSQATTRATGTSLTMTYREQREAVSKGAHSPKKGGKMKEIIFTPAKNFLKGRKKKKK